MADWVALGTVAPYFDWKFFDIPIVGSEILRVRHTNWIYPQWGYAWLAFSWDIGSDSGKFGFKKIFPKEENETIVCPVPPQLAQVGVSVRYAIIKLDNRAQWTDPTWSVSLDALNYVPVNTGSGGSSGSGGDDGGIG
jgi:hypothetical protein